MFNKIAFHIHFTEFHDRARNYLKKKILARSMVHIPVSEVSQTQKRKILHDASL